MIECIWLRVAVRARGVIEREAVHLEKRPVLFMIAAECDWPQSNARKKHSSPQNKLLLALAPAARPLIIRSSSRSRRRCASLYGAFPLALPPAGGASRSSLASRR